MYIWPIPLKPKIPAISAITTAAPVLLVCPAKVTAEALFCGFPQVGQKEEFSEGKVSPQFLKIQIGRAHV